MEGHLERDGHRTWYRVAGELDPDALRAPVVICHGGPGATHDYVAPIAELSRTGRACVLYDQLGNGHSDHLPDADPSFWTVELFKDELTALTEHLGIAGRYHVVGQSWGGMLAFDHALDHPPGLLSIVGADAPADAAAFAAGACALVDTLPAEAARAIRHHEAAGTTDSPEYEAAIMEFYTRYVCRLDPWPDALVATFDAMEADPTVYRTMNGPSEFTVVGTIRDWSVVDRLPEIDVPVLLVSGEHDEVRPDVVRVIDERVPDSEWILFEDCSHSPHLEAPERFLRVVEGFLERVEGPGGGR
ncbi:MAG: L-proline amide hydrolase [Solirubrobacteraceae bacterium]|jgi:L-proline amide hydrolase|nr:L-proline amide hydrolase [Solirubrobacteraceae bacterium]